MLLSTVPKIHYHSECPFFAGCENMLANFFNSKQLASEYQISFSYVNSKKYIEGLLTRVPNPPSLYPITFAPSLPPLLFGNPILAFILKLFRIGSDLLIVYPAVAYQAYVLYKLFKKIRPDIVHINNGGYPAARSALAATLAAKLAGTPHVLMVVNNMALGYWHYSRLLDRPLDYLVSHCTGIFVTGSIVASKRLRDVLKLPRDKITQIYNGVPKLQTYSSRHETLARLGLSEFKGAIFGVVALLVPRKGHQVLLEAVARLASNRPRLGRPFHILIEGSGPLERRLIKYVNDNCLREYITFVGEEKNIADFMNAVDGLILPSVSHEDFPNVISEAMSFAKPVIASRIAGTPEQVLHNITGILVEPRNVYQLAEAISILASSPSLRSKMGQAALSRYEANFTPETAVSNYMNLYSTMIESRHA